MPHLAGTVTLDRRGFLALLGSAGLSWPRALEALATELAPGGGPDDEPFWEQVRGHFLIPRDRIYLNNGTLGPSPRAVLDAVFETERRVAATYPPGVAWDDLKAAMASFVGGDPGGFVFPRNTTEGMNFVAGGLELAPGDEVVTTDHEHIGGLEPWRLVTRRRRARLVVASLPVPAPSSGALLEAVWAHVGPRTRAVSVSHVTFTNGTVMPVSALARRCADAGITMVVDGAHPPGMIAVDLAALGPDFYASSPHKWMLAPQGTGMLYLAPAWRERLWPIEASGGWDDLSLGAQRFNHLGTIDESRLAGLLAAVGFLQAIGVSRIEARVRHLASMLRTGLAEIPGVRIVTPAAPELSAAMVSFELEGVASLDLQRHLARTAKVRTRVVSEYGYGWMRLSTHVYNLPADVHRVLELLDAAARRGIAPSGGSLGA